MFHTQGFYFLFICVSSLCFLRFFAMLPPSCSEEVNNVRHTLNNISLKSCFSVPATIFTDCSVQLSSCVITDIPIGVRKECRIIFSVLHWFNHQGTGRFNTVPEVYMYFIKCICCWKENGFIIKYSRWNVMSMAKHWKVLFMVLSNYEWLTGLAEILLHCAQSS